jgi:hypothetical protein
MVTKAKPAAPPQSTTKRIAKHPATAAGGGVSLLSIVPFLPPNWQPYGYAITGLLGLVAPLLASRQQQQRTTD